MADSTQPTSIVLPTLEGSSSLDFHAPIKKINEGQDVSHFLQSKAYSDLMSFLLQLNRAMFPVYGKDRDSSSVTSWQTNANHVRASNAVVKLVDLLRTLSAIIEDAPPNQGPRRFGNVAFKQWYEIASSRAPQLLSEALPAVPEASHVEILPYLLGSFGSAQRLDYGSGHELSFLAFLGCIWKLGVFDSTIAEEESRAIVIHIFQPYFDLIRSLVKTYTLEPAGSHGVWGLDDHSFLPYVFGSAQLGPPVTPADLTPIEGSMEGAPDPGDVAQASKSTRYKDSNMYFSAICFIHEVKKGPFFEHSPMLYDISGIRAGWGKINKGMIKMYSAEVLSKFPVVQHFPFGSLFSWDRDPIARDVAVNVHLASQPHRPDAVKSIQVPPITSTEAPWATAKQPNVGPGRGTKAPWAGAAPPTAPEAGTKAPWVAARGLQGDRDALFKRPDLPSKLGREDGSGKGADQSNLRPT